MIPDFARDILDGRDIVMLSDGIRDAHLLLRRRRVTGYYKVLVRGRDGEAYNIGVEEPEISMAELAERLVELGRTLFGYQGAVVRRASERARVPRRQPGRGAVP